MSGNNPEGNQTAKLEVERQATRLAEYIAAEVERRRQKFQRELDERRARLLEVEVEIRRAGDDLDPTSQLAERIRAIHLARMDREPVLKAGRQAIEEATKKLEALNVLTFGWSDERIQDCARIIVRDFLPMLTEAAAAGRRASFEGRSQVLTHSPLVQHDGFWQQLTETMTFLGFDAKDHPKFTECSRSLYVLIRSDDSE
jgi:hypothetical protein